MIGHKKIIEDLQKLADAGGLAHGYIFFGPAMVGKKMVARGLAGYLENGTFAEVPLLIDGIVIEPGENGSIGIDAAREIKQFLWQKPNTSPRRTLIIDDADCLTTQAQNALLKITEEPPASSLMILVTQDLESIIPTILSRFQSIYFGTVPEGEIVGWLLAGGDRRQETRDRDNFSKDKISGVAKKSFGKPGLALRLLNDEVLRKNMELAEKFLKSATAPRRDLIKKIIEPDEFDLRQFLDAVILVLASEKPSKKGLLLWHKTLALYEKQTNFSLNPRLQLEALMA